MGLRFGPASTLAKKPYRSKTSNQDSPVRMKDKDRTTTMAATKRAATSLTGLGNVKMDFIRIVNIGWPACMVFFNLMKSPR